MAKDIYINPLTHDIDLTNKSMRLTNSIPESSRQQVDINLKTFKGEWFANILAGIPYLANDTNPIQLLGVTDKAFFDTIIKSNILARENVKEIKDYTSVLDKNKREIVIDFVAVTLTDEEIAFVNIPIVIV